MKKKYIATCGTIARRMAMPTIALGLMLAAGTSCSDDDDDDEDEEKQDNTQGTTDNTQQQTIKDNSKTVTDAVKNVVAATTVDGGGSSSASSTTAAIAKSALDNLKEAVDNVVDQVSDQAKDGTATDVEAVKQAIVEEVSKETGLSAETVKTIIDAKTPTEAAKAVEEEAKTNPQAVETEDVKQAQAACTNAQTLSSTFEAIKNGSEEEKTAAVSALAKAVTENYKQNSSEAYKQAYLNAAAAVAGEDQSIVKQIFESGNTEETIKKIFKIGQVEAGDGGQTTAEAQADGKTVGPMVEQFRGKSALDIMGDIDNSTETAEALMKVAKKYTAGTSDYQQALPTALSANSKMSESDAKELLEAAKSGKQSTIIAALQKILGIAFGK